MNYKKIFILLLVFSILILAIPGCTSSQEEGNTRLKPQSLEEPPPPIELKLVLSHAPKVGETTEVTLIIIDNYLSSDQLGNIRAWLEFTWINTAGSYQESKQQIEVPLEKVLTRGDLNWEGILTSDTPIEFHAGIRFPEEGYWEITGYIEGKVGRIRSNRVELVIEHDRACIVGSEDYYNWAKDYSPGVVENLNAPITATLDLSKAPRLGEPVELTWSIAPVDNIEKASVRIEFKLLELGSLEAQRPASESILVYGDLKWQGSLKKGVPFATSATVVFPVEGDWEIVLWFGDPESGRFSEYCHVFLNVTEERGRWGWAEPHESRKDAPPPTPVEESR